MKRKPEKKKKLRKDRRRGIRKKHSPKGRGKSLRVRG